MAKASIGWGLGDQAISSLTNFGLGIAVARSVSPYEFGVFTIVFSAYLVALNLSRAFSTDPLIVRFTASNPGAWRSAVSDASGTALLISGAFAGASLVVAVAVSSMRVPFLVLALCLPGLLLQDAYRSSFFAEGKAHKAFWNDLVWLVLLLTGVSISFLSLASSLYPFLIAWGLGGSIAAVCGGAQMGIWPSCRSARKWLSTHKDLGPRYAGEFLLGAGGSQLSLLGVGALAGLRTAGALRAAQLLLGGITMIFQGVSLTQTPEAVKLARKDASLLRRRAAILSASLALAAALWTLMIYLIPSSIGENLMGSNWSGARSVILPVGAAMSSAGIVAGAVICMRALGAARHSLRAQLTSAPCMLLITLIGAMAFSALGAAVGMAIGSMIAAFVWWSQLGRALAGRKKSEAVARGSDGSREV